MRNKMEGFVKYQKIRNFKRATGNCCPLWVRTLICLWGTTSPWFLGWMFVRCSPLPRYRVSRIPIRQSLCSVHLATVTGPGMGTWPKSVRWKVFAGTPFFGEAQLGLPQAGVLCEPPHGGEHAWTLCVCRCRGSKIRGVERARLPMAPCKHEIQLCLNLVTSLTFTGASQLLSA